MTISHEENAATSNKTSQLRRREMNITRALPKPREPLTTAHSNDREMAISKASYGSKQKSKQSLDYVLRTGLAGGLAGCAVRPSSLSWRLITSQIPG